MLLALSILLSLTDATEIVPCNYYIHFTYGNLNDGNCKNCSCDEVGSQSAHCHATKGDCYCKRGHTGRKCDKCQDGYWRLPRLPCTECECSELGSSSSVCSSSGQCPCQPGYSGRDCSECQTGYTRNETLHCAECDNCARKILVSLEESSVKQSGIKTVSQDHFISKTTAKLKRLQKKSNRIKEEMLHRISVFVEFKETFTDVGAIVFSPSQQTKSLRRQAKMLLLKFRKSDDRIDGRIDGRIEAVEFGVNSSFLMKDQYFRDAYFQYYNAMYKLPEKLKDLSVTKGQLRAISKEVRRLDDRYIDTKLRANVAVRDEYGTLLSETGQYLEQAKDVKNRVRGAANSIDSQVDRVVGLSTTLAELQYDEVDDSLLVETQINMNHVSYVFEKFLGWKSEVEENIEGIGKDIVTSSSSLRVQNLSTLMSEVGFIRQSIVDLPGTLPIPSSLDSSTCQNTVKLIRSMFHLFSVILIPRPVRDMELVREIISNIDTVTELQELTVKYRNSEKLASRVRARARRMDKRSITRLKSSMQVCNHRLKDLNDRNKVDQDRLRTVKTHLQILTTSNVRPDDSKQAKMDQLEEDLTNLTLKKRKFRALEKSINISMERIQRKMDAIKLKVLAFESIKFDKNEWSRYDLPDQVKEISVSFRSDRKSGTVLSVGRTGKEEDLLVSVSENTLSFTCYEPKTIPMYTVCPESLLPPCYSKSGTFRYSEWYDPRATFDPTHFASLQIIFQYGAVTVNAYQKEKLFFSQSAPCVITPESMALTKRPSKGSGLIETGFTGCITQLQIDRLPRGIRQANHTSGHLRRCEDKDHVQKSVRESACGMSYLSLSSETLLQPSFSEKLQFRVLVGSFQQKVNVMSVGQLRITARKGKVFGTCNQFKIRITFRNVYVTNEPFDMALEVFENYISLTVSRTDNEPRTRKLPCVLRPEMNDFIVGSDSPGIDGCIKKL